MLLEFRQKNRRFICKKCGKKSFDRPDASESKDKNVEIELLDICKQCFKNYKKETRQIYILTDLLQKGLVSQDEMKHLTDLRIAGLTEAFNKLRIELLRRNENKEGSLKNRKLMMIQKLRGKKN